MALRSADLLDPPESKPRSQIWRIFLLAGRSENYFSSACPHCPNKPKEKSAKIEVGENSLIEQIICGLHLAMAVYHANEAPL